jgi:hypothetical protein
MGWFLKRNKRKRPTSKPKRKTGGRAIPWDPRRTMLLTVALASLITLTAVVFGWQWADRALERYVAANKAAPVTEQTVELRDAPPWMSVMLRSELHQLVARQMNDNPLDGSDLGRAAAALRECAWVRQVHTLHREPNGRVVVRADYREPIAVVRCRDGYRLIDVQGVRLPGLYLEHQASRLGLPLIIGVAAQPAGEGDVWPGDDVQAAVRLVTLLGDEPYSDQILAYDVSGRDSRGRLRLALRTGDGGLVRWGLAPGREQAVEPDAATKKNWLASVYRQRGRIDAGGKVVDLYGAAVFVHQAPAQDSAERIGYHW